MTAGEVAEELEISERTARRDLEALGAAGLPVYSTQGRNGGWQLLGDARTDLSGLTGPEARALFLVAGPASAATPAVKAGLRKLLSALPTTMQDEAERAASAVIVDPVRWGDQAREKPADPWLDCLQSAVITGEQLNLSYRSPKGETTTRVVHPLGIAAKGAHWYLVANTDAGMRTFRVDRVTSAVETGLPVVRPEGFDLASAWKLIAERVGDLWKDSVRAVAEADSLPSLRWVFGPRLRVGPAVDDGRVEIEIAAPDGLVTARKIAGFGALVEVVEPDEFRVELQRIGNELVNLYQPKRRRQLATPTSSP